MLIKHLLKQSPSKETITALGWIKTNRSSKAVSFIELNDGSAMTSIQAVVPDTISNYEDVSKAGTGSSIEVTGKIVASPGGKQKTELLAETVKIIGSADDSYILQKKRHSFEFLRGISHLRPRTNTLGATFRVRSKLAHAIHSFFQEEILYIYIAQ